MRQLTFDIGFDQRITVAPIMVRAGRDGEGASQVVGAQRGQADEQDAAGVTTPAQQGSIPASAPPALRAANGEGSARTATARPEPPGCRVRARVCPRPERSLPARFAPRSRPPAPPLSKGRGRRSRKSGRGAAHAVTGGGQPPVGGQQQAQCQPGQSPAASEGDQVLPVSPADAAVSRPAPPAPQAARGSPGQVANREGLHDGTDPEHQQQQHRRQPVDSNSAAPRVAAACSPRPAPAASRAAPRNPTPAVSAPPHHEPGGTPSNRKCQHCSDRRAVRIAASTALGNQIRDEQYVGLTSCVKLPDC